MNAYRGGKKNSFFLSHVHVWVCLGGCMTARICVSVSVSVHDRHYVSVNIFLCGQRERMHVDNCESSGVRWLGIPSSTQENLNGLKPAAVMHFQEKHPS